MVIQISTVAQFDEIVAKNEVVIVDFFATWCMPCKMYTPVVEQYSASHPNHTVVKVDVDKLPELAQRYQVYSIPHTQVIVKQETKEGFAGYRDLETLVADIKRSL